MMQIYKTYIWNEKSSIMHLKVENVFLINYLIKYGADINKEKHFGQINICKK